jgi:hypothetical protein
VRRREGICCCGSLVASQLENLVPESRGGNGGTARETYSVHARELADVLCSVLTVGDRAGWRWGRWFFGIGHSTEQVEAECSDLRDVEQSLESLSSDICSSPPSPQMLGNTSHRSSDASRFHLRCDRTSTFDTTTSTIHLTVACTTYVNALFRPYTVYQQELPQSNHAPHPWATRPVYSLRRSDRDSPRHIERERTQLPCRGPCPGPGLYAR